MKQPNEIENAIPENSSSSIKKIGNTTYEINIFFNQDAKAKVEDKIFRLIKNVLSES